MSGAVQSLLVIIFHSFLCSSSPSHCFLSSPLLSLSPIFSWSIPYHSLLPSSLSFLCSCSLVPLTGDFQLSPLNLCLIFFPPSPLSLFFLSSYPDATIEELEAVNNVCIICREEMVSRCKKLPCNHIFHTACLQSWFQRQQTCPTCRMDILNQNLVNHLTQGPQAGQGQAAQGGQRHLQQPQRQQQPPQAFQPLQQNNGEFISAVCRR